MTLHFAYGSNMSRRGMRARCPHARAIGTITLPGWRFIIGRDGFASLVRQPGSRVHGVLWRLSTRDVAAINAYESVQTGLYVRRRLPVRLELGHASSCAGPARLSAHERLSARLSATALVYIARRRGIGAARPGYVHLVVEAARDWSLPQAYIRSLARWAPSRWRGARATDTGEVQ
jgi:gamma-glutamyl AIG2-like cyclotransferase